MACTGPLLLSMLEKKHQKLFNIGEQEIHCIPEGVRANHAKLKVARRLQLPAPQIEVLVSGKASKGIKYFGMPHAVA